MRDRPIVHFITGHVWLMPRAISRPSATFRLEREFLRLGTIGSLESHRCGC